MDEEVARRRYEREHDPARVLALSDGVFAIIITLLVLEIHVPELSQGQTFKGALERSGRRSSRSSSASWSSRSHGRGTGTCSR